MAALNQKFETVCIRRTGAEIVRGFGIDAAAMVVYQGSAPGEVFYREAVKSVWLVPLGRPGDYSKYF